MDESLDLSFELWLLCILTPRKQKVISYRGEPVTFGPRGNSIQLLIMVVCIPHILWTVGDRVTVLSRQMLNTRSDPVNQGLD
jgi:hypothetical protein